MPTQAISAYGIQVRLSNGVALPALTITAASNTTPIIVTTSVAHGIADVTPVTVTGVLGNLGANGAWIAERVTNTTLKLRQSVGSGAYTSGGTLTPVGTFTTIAELTNLEDQGLMTTVVQASAHDGNGWGTSIPTFLNGNTMRLSLNEVPLHATHDHLTGLKFLMRTKTKRNFLVVFPDATKSAWLWAGWVVQYREQAPVQGVLTSTVSIEIDGAPLLSAA
jgi:hypothetical protein